MQSTPSKQTLKEITLFTFLNKNPKILFAGDKASGKTSLIKSMTSHSFNLKEKPTSSVETHELHFKISDEQYTVSLIDTPGGMKFLKSPDFFSDFDIIVLVYDITRASSIEYLAENLEEIGKTTNGVSIMLVGTKKDLTNLRNLNLDDMTELAEPLNATVTELSCLDSETVGKFFKTLISNLIKEY